MRKYTNFKDIETNRYNERSKLILSKKSEILNNFKFGSEAISVIFRKPYEFYEAQIKKHLSPDKKHLDVCCGDGTHSFTGVRLGATVVVSDIAEKSVELVLHRANQMNFSITGVVADAEKLPFLNNSFDVITCAGSLSYVDINVFFTFCL